MMQGPSLSRLVSSAHSTAKIVPRQSLNTFPLFGNRIDKVCATSVQTSFPSQTSQKRHAHSRRNVSSAAVDLPQEDATITPSRPKTLPSDLACLPLATLIRSYLITAVSSHSILLKPSLSFLSFLAHSKWAIFDPDRSPILRMLLKQTVYAQFCAGETPGEVKQTLAGLKSMGYKGVLLGHAREVVMTAEEAKALEDSTDCAEQERCDAEDIRIWKKNTLDTVELTQKDDFVALKFSGAGRQALKQLKATKPCAPAFEEALHEICQRAQERDVGLLFDAEQASIQQGIDNWTMYFAKRYNQGEKALVYGTYQAYAKRTPKILAQHLQQAFEQKFVLGVKLVRGAYLGSDPRELFWPTIQDTHKCYDGIAESMIKQEYNSTVQPADPKSPKFPQVNLVLASHNAESIQRAQKLRDEQAEKGQTRSRMAYGQLMGMADNVSCQLVRTARERMQMNNRDAEIPKAYKYLVWGKMGECMKYLVRRAQENSDAVTRTVDARKALGQELGRRMGLSSS